MDTLCDYTAQSDLSFPLVERIRPQLLTTMWQFSAIHQSKKATGHGRNAVGLLQQLFSPPVCHSLLFSRSLLLSLFLSICSSLYHAPTEQRMTSSTSHPTNIRRHAGTRTPTHTCATRTHNCTHTQACTHTCAVTLPVFLSPSCLCLPLLLCWGS